MDGNSALHQCRATGAQQAVDVPSRQLIDTYEAQVLLSLREIDQTLKFIQYAYENESPRAALEDLATKNLWLPELLFVMRITDPQGNILASTNAELDRVDSAYFQKSIHNDSLWVSSPQRGFGFSEAYQHFSRRVNDADRDLAEVVTISVASAHFVSGYESSKLDGKGSVGIIGGDGVFLVNRAGNAVSVGDKVDYTSVAGANQLSSEGAVVVPSWDGVRRHVRAREL